MTKLSLNLCPKTSLLYGFVQVANCYLLISFLIYKMKIITLSLFKCLEN